MMLSARFKKLRHIKFFIILLQAEKTEDGKIKVASLSPRGDLFRKVSITVILPTVNIPFVQKGFNHSRLTSGIQSQSPAFVYLLVYLKVESSLHGPGRAAQRLSGDRYGPHSFSCLLILLQIRCFPPLCHGEFCSHF